MPESNDAESFLEYLARNKPAQQKIRVVTKRGRRSSQFAEISNANTQIVDDLVLLAEKLADDGNGKAAREIIGIIRQLLDNNNKLQKVVSEALQDIPG